MTDVDIDRQLNESEQQTRMRQIFQSRVGLREYIGNMRGNTTNCRKHFVDSIKRGSEFGAVAGLLIGTMIGVRSKNVPCHMATRVIRACVVSVPVGALMFTGAGLTAGIGYCLFYPMQRR